jgi:hypothetical protein
MYTNPCLPGGSGMREEYKKEIEKLTIQLEKAEKFAQKLPIFERYIIENKVSGEEDSMSFGICYKEIPLNWGIYRLSFKEDSGRTVANYYGKELPCFLFSIYINIYDLFGHNNKFRVYDIAEKIPLFFYDVLNSTFYATDDQITNLLEELNAWYLLAKEENIIFLAEQRLKEAKKEMEKQQKILDSMSPMFEEVK